MLVPRPMPLEGARAGLTAPALASSSSLSIPITRLLTQPSKLAYSIRNSAAVRGAVPAWRRR